MTASEAPPMAAGETSVVQDITGLARVLFEPTAVFEEQREKPAFWVPWLVVSAGFAVVGWLMVPFQQRSMELAAAAAGRPAPPAWTTMLGVVGSPVFVLMFAALSAFLLWVICLAMGGETTFRRLLTVSIYAWPIGLLQMLATFLVLKMRGLESIRSAADMKVSLGLDLLVPADAALPKFVAGMLAGIGVFEIWGLVITAMGLAVLAKLPGSKAWTAATAAFVLGLVIRGAFSLLQP